MVAGAVLGYNFGDGRFNDHRRLEAVHDPGGSPTRRPRVSEAVVVGSGPNGLACAALLARAGVTVTVIEAANEVGGGARTSELTVPGVLHDDCSAVQPMAVTSPAFNELGLIGNGLDWDWAEVDLGHPLDGDGAMMTRSLDETARGLGADGRTWKRLFGRPAAGFETLSSELTEPILHLPSHPLRLAA